MTVRELLNELSGMVDEKWNRQRDTSNDWRARDETSDRRDKDLEAIVRVIVLFNRHMPGKLDCEVKS